MDIFLKTDINQNKFNFTITIITSKNSYTINRYINENQMGFLIKVFKFYS